MSLHAPSPRRERIIIYADNGGGKSSAYISLADWMVRTRSHDKLWLFDTQYQWPANSGGDSYFDPVVNWTYLDRADFGVWKDQAERVRKAVKPDDWIVVDMMMDAWNGAQSHYWGEKSGNSSLAELWLKNRPQDVAGDHGTNWGIINKFYNEFRLPILNAPCHVLMLTTAKPIRKPNEAGKGGDDLNTRNFYGKTEMQMEGQKELRGDGFSVLYAFEANGKYRYTSVKEMGPIGRPKRQLLAGADVSEKGFVQGYLMPVAGWRP